MDIQAIERKQSWASEKGKLVEGISVSCEQVMALLRELEDVLSIIEDCIADDWCEEYWFRECYGDLEIVSGYVYYIDECLTSYAEFLADQKVRIQDIAEYGEQDGDDGAIEIASYCPFEEEGGIGGGSDYEMFSLFCEGKIPSLLSHIEHRLRDDLRTGGAIRFHGFLKDIVDYDFHRCIENSLEFYSMNEDKEFFIKSFDQLPSVVDVMAKRISCQYDDLAEKLKHQLVDFYRFYDGLFPKSRQGLKDHE